MAPERLGLVQSALSHPMRSVEGGGELFRPNRVQIRSVQTKTRIPECIMLSVTVALWLRLRAEEKRLIVLRRAALAMVHERVLQA